MYPEYLKVLMENVELSREQLQLVVYLQQQNSETSGSNHRSEFSL